MARARNIKPGIMDNEVLAECDFSARLLFVYLWMLADRDGRLEDRPKRIRVQAFPYDEGVDADTLLQQLHEKQFIQRYEVDGNQYIQILKFSEHQTPHVKEKASTIPAPDRVGARPVQAPDKVGAVTGQGSAEHETSTNPAPPDSLIPDSLIPDNKTYCASGDARREDFLKFWDLFGYKKGKDPAWKAWKKITHYKPELVERIFTAAKEEAERRPALIANGRTPKMAQGWISDKRWEDEGGDEFGASKPQAQRKTTMQADMDDLDALLGGGNGKQGMGKADGGVNAQSSKVIELERHTSGNYG